jgi:DNA-binding transcriptional LysR family regulator
MKDIFTLRLYTRVARLGSFSAAAREVGLSQSQTSRAIADLEADLGTRLLSRTTRAVVPTEAGTEFLARIEPILIALDEAEHCVREGGDLRGLLRMSMPNSIALREIIPRLADFTEQHPGVELQMLLEDRRQDLVRDAVDVAIRVGSLPDSSAVAKPLATIPRMVLAAPSYLARAGTPCTPGDLAAHRIVGGPASVVPTAWRFERDGEVIHLELKSHFHSNENEAAVAAAVAGMGITSTTGWACQRELAEGSLVHLFPGWRMADVPVYAYYPHGRATRALARAAVQHLVASLAANPGVARLPA